MEPSTFDSLTFSPDDGLLSVTITSNTDHQLVIDTTNAVSATYKIERKDTSATEPVYLITFNLHVCGEEPPESAFISDYFDWNGVTDAYTRARSELVSLG